GEGEHQLSPAADLDRHELHLELCRGVPGHLDETAAPFASAQVLHEIGRIVEDREPQFAGPLDALPGAFRILRHRGGSNSDRKQKCGNDCDYSPFYRSHSFAPFTVPDYAFRTSLAFTSS